MNCRARAGRRSYSCDDRFAHVVLRGLFERRPHARLPQGAGRVRLLLFLLHDPLRPRCEPQPARSPSLVAEARQHRRRPGRREIVMTGVNTGDFGRTTGERFIDLLRALNEVEGIERYRISSIEPESANRRNHRTFAPRHLNSMHHFHIPLQSGSDRILGLMRRRYTTARFAERIAAVRRLMPDAFIGIDVIVGFPGETEADFRTTYDFLAGLELRRSSISFPSRSGPVRRPSTCPARCSRRSPLQRVNRTGGRSATACTAISARRAEGTESVRCSSRARRRGGMMFGFTGNYIRVKAPYERCVDQPDLSCQARDDGRYARPCGGDRAR